MKLYLRKVASEGINHHVEHCVFVPASRVLFSSRCPTFRVSLLSSSFQLCAMHEVCPITSNSRSLLTHHHPLGPGFGCVPLPVTVDERFSLEKACNLTIIHSYSESDIPKISQDIPNAEHMRVLTFSTTSAGARTTSKATSSGKKGAITTSRCRCAHAAPSVVLCTWKDGPWGSCATCPQRVV